MDKKLWVLNIVYAVIDTLIAAMGLVAFAFGAYYFNRWWILLFDIIPLALFNTHTLVVNTDLETQKGDEDNAGRESD